MSLLGFIIGNDDEQQRGQQLDAQLKALNDRDYSKGGRVYNEIADQQGPAAAVVASQIVQEHLAMQEEQTRQSSAEDEFYSSLSETSSGYRKFFGGLVGSVLGVIPLSVWILAAVGLFLYMGGWLWLKGRFLK